MYADSCFELFFHMNRYPILRSLVSPHNILCCESKSTVTHHPPTRKTCVSLILAPGQRSVSNAPYNSQFGQLSTAEKNSWTSISLSQPLTYTVPKTEKPRCYGEKVLWNVCVRTRRKLRFLHEQSISRITAKKGVRHICILHILVLYREKYFYNIYIHTLIKIRI